MIEAELPDGRVLEFPDGTDPAVIQTKVKELLGATAQPAAPAQLPPDFQLPEGSANLMPTPQQKPLPTRALEAIGVDSPIANMFTDNLFGAAQAIRNPAQAAQELREDAFPEGGPSVGELARQKVGAGLANVAGFPADLVGMGSELGRLVSGEGPMKPLPYGDIPFTSQDIKDKATGLAESRGMKVYGRDEMSPLQNMFGTALEFGTTAAVPSGLLTRAMGNRVAADAAKGASMTRKPQGILEKIAQPQLQAAQRAQTGAGSQIGAFAPLARDVTAGMGSGAAFEAVNPEENPLTALVASVIGGGAGSKIPDIMTSPVRGARAVASAATPAKGLPFLTPEGEQFTQRAAEKAAAKLKANTQDAGSAIANLERAVSQADEFGSPLPTTGLVSDDPGLLIRDRELRRSGGDALPPGEVIALDRRVEQDIVDRTRTAERSATPNEPRLREFAGEEIGRETAGPAMRRTAAEESVEQAEAGVKALDTELEGTSARVADKQTMGTIDRQKALDDVIVNTLDERTKGVQATRAAIPPSSKVDADSFSGALDAIESNVARLGSLGSLKEELPDTVLMKFYRENKDGKLVRKKTPDNIGALVQFSDRLAKDASDPTLPIHMRDNIRSLRRAVGEQIDKLAEQGVPQAAEAQRYYREEFAPFFGEGVGKEFRKKLNADDLSRTKTPPTATEAMFLKTGAGSLEAAQDLKRILKAAPDGEQGQEAVRNYLTASLAKALDKKGLPDPKYIDKWAQNHEGILRAFPEFGADVAQLQKDIKAGLTRRSQLVKDLDTFKRELRAADKDVAAANQRIAKSHLQLMLDGNDYEAAATVLRSKTSDKDMAGILQRIKAAKDPALLDAWKHSVGTAMYRQVANTGSGARTTTGEAPVSLKKIFDVMQSKRKTLEQVFTPEEMRALDHAKSQAEALSRRGVSSGGIGSTTAEDRATFDKIGELGLRIRYGILRGGGYARSIRTAVSLLPQGKRAVQAEQIFVQSLVDPRLALHLLKMPDAAPEIVKWRRTLNTMIAAEQDLVRQLDKPEGEE